MVLELVVDDDEVVRRPVGPAYLLSGAGGSGTPPVRPAVPVPGICDDCGGELFQRDDDREETIRHRLEVYQQQTSPLIAFYADEGILLGIDATGPVEEVTDARHERPAPFHALMRATHTPGGCGTRGIRRHDADKARS